MTDCLASGLNEQAKKGLERILEISSSNDVEILRAKFDLLRQSSTSQEEAAKVVLKQVRKPSILLRQKNIKKEVIITYLKEIGVRVPTEMIKDVCIRICLEKWQVKNDNFWEKERSEEKNRRDSSHMDIYINKKKQEIGLETQINKNNLIEILGSVKGQNHLQQSTEQNRNEDVQILSHTIVGTDSPPKELSDSSLKNSRTRSLPSVSSTHKAKRTMVPCTTTPTGSASLDSFGGTSTLFPESIDFLLPVHNSERNQSVSPLVPSLRSSAPACHDFSQTTFASKTLNSSSSGEDMSSGMMFAQPLSTEPSSISSQSLDRNHVTSVSTMENERKSAPDIPVSSSVSSGRIFKKEPPELQSTEPFSLSMEMSNLPSVSIVEGEPQSTAALPASSSSVSSDWIDRKERKMSKVKHPSASKLRVSVPSFHHVGIQTLPSESPDDSSTVFQTNRRGVQSSKNDKLPPSHENLGRKFLNSKRLFLASPRRTCTKSRTKNNWNDLSLLSKRKNSTAEVSSVKMPSTNSSVFGNLNRSELTSSECPKCKIHSPFLYSDANESYFSSEHLGFKKKHPSSLSKEVPSIGKKQRMSHPSKRANQEPSTLAENTKVSKRKYPASSLKERATPTRQSTFPSKHPRYSSVSSSEHLKQSKSASIKVNNKRGNGLKKPKTTRDGVPYFKTMSRKALKSGLATLGSESSADSLLTKNTSNDTTESLPGPSSVPAELMCGGDSKLTSPDDSSDISEKDENPSTECSSSPDLEEPLPRPKRRRCILL